MQTRQCKNGSTLIYYYDRLLIQNVCESELMEINNISGV